MKALSIRQPWAWLIAQGIKDIENRNWRSDYTGLLLIHASKTWDQKGFDFISDYLDEYVPRKDDHDFGAFVGIVEMVDCVDQWDSKWFFGDYGFVFEQAREFRRPIYYPGRLGIFDVPGNLIKMVRRLHI